MTSVKSKLGMLFLIFIKFSVPLSDLMGRGKVLTGGVKSGYFMGFPCSLKSLLKQVKMQNLECTQNRAFLERTET